MAIQNDYNRKYGPSPQYKWTNGAITDDNAVNVHWETQDKTSMNYLPFNFTRIINNSTVGIYFYPNQNTNDPWLIPAGTILSIDRKMIPAINGFSIKRASATTVTAGSVIVTNSKEAEGSDSIVSRLHRRLFGHNDSRVI